MTPAFRAVTGAVAVSLALAAVPAQAQDAAQPAGYARQGAYVGVTPLLNFTLDGTSFDGKTYYREINGAEVFILPRLDKQNMLRAVVGFRSRPLAIEFSYERARHGGTFLDVPAGAVFQAFNADARFFFLTAGRIQPHAVVGISFPLLTVDDGASDGTSTANARFRGTGANTEIGVTFFATPRLGVSVGWAYRPIWFTTVHGVTDTTFELRPRFRESSNNAMVMVFFTL